MLQRKRNLQNQPRETDGVFFMKDAMRVILLDVGACIFVPAGLIGSYASLGIFSQLQTIRFSVWQGSWVA